MKGNYGDRNDVFTLTEDVIIKAGTEFKRELGTVYIAETDNGSFVVEDKYFKEVEPEKAGIDFSEIEYLINILTEFKDEFDKVFISHEEKGQHIFLSKYEIIFDHNGAEYTKKELQEFVNDLIINICFPTLVKNIFGDFNVKD